MAINPIFDFAGRAFSIGSRLLWEGKTCSLAI